jgi:Histidine kinase-, DNA gyrase B-, and HSP90-like ATPase/Response regulator receiver domain
LGRDLAHHRSRNRRRHATRRSDNAARYTAPGGHVQVSAVSEASELVIRVVDDGQGIQAQLLPRLFEPFVQGERGSDRREGGLGLGLAVVKGLVALHAGSVEAHSDGPGLGSEFVVRVPGLTTLEAPLERGEAEPVTSTPARPRSRRVLVTDDNEDAANLLAEVLIASGHEVTVAYDGPTALSIAGTFRPEVAILDIGLPSMDGYELLRRLRERDG